MEASGDHITKALLIHVTKIKDPAGEEQTLEEIESNLKYCQKNKQHHKEVNSWYILEHTTEGPKISETLHNIRPNQSEDKWLDSTSSAIVGSSLFVIGGHINPNRHRDSVSNQVHCLDLNNPADGWKTSSIPFQVANVSAKVLGNLILFPPSNEIKQIDPTKPDHWYYHNSYAKAEFGLVYDTTENVVHKFKPPPGYVWDDETCYLPLEGRGRGLVFPLFGKMREKRVFLHDPVQNSWEQLHDCSSFFRETSNRYTLRTVSNGILYILNDESRYERYSICTTVLSAYDLNNGRKIFRKKLRVRLGNDGHKWLVPVSDFELCLLWCDNSLHYAKIWVSLDPPTVSITEETSLTFDASSVLNILPFNPEYYPFRNKEIFDVTSNKQTVLELYWKKCCELLLKENLYLEEEAEELRPKLGSSCKKDIAPRVPTLVKEKSILIHVSRFAHPSEAQGCEALELQFHKSIKPPFFSGDENPNLPKTDSWFVIKHTATGPQISEVFHNVPQDHPNIFCGGSNSAIVGTSLYVIGGQYDFSGYKSYYSNEIRRFDFEDTTKGWKISKLPYYFSNGCVEVADNFIYLLPSRIPYVKRIWAEKNLHEYGIDCDVTRYPWGLVYDTIKHEANPLKLPQDMNDEFEDQDTFGFHLKGRGVLVPLGKSRSEGYYGEYIKDEFYIHDPRQNSWELQDSYFDFDPKMYEHHRGNNCVVSNGMLLTFRFVGARESYFFVDAYDYNASSANFLDLLFEINLPQFEFLDFSGYYFRVVAVDDLTFCLLGKKHEQYGFMSNKDPLLYAKVLLSLDPSPTVTILEESWFPMEGIKLLNCLAFDSDLYPSLFEESSVLDQQNDENPLASSSSEAEATEKEVYWKQCFKKLLEDNKRLQKEIQELKGRKMLPKLKVELEVSPRMNAVSEEKEDEKEDDSVNDEEVLLSGSLWFPYEGMGSGSSSSDEE